MTDAARAPATVARRAAERSADSKDYWDDVFEQLGRRPLVRAAVAVLVLLYASAVYAPLIANDRPYVLQAVDEKSYDAARKGLTGVAASIRELAFEGEAAYRERQAGKSAPSYAAALEAERNALSIRLDAMRLYLPPEQLPRLAAFEAEADLCLAEVARGGGGELGARAEALLDAARALRADCAPKDATQSSPGVVLRARLSLPLLESISGVEAGFMTLFAFLLTFPLWNRLVNRALLQGKRERVRRARRRKLGALLGASVACGLVWHVFVGGRTTFDLAPYKPGLTSGEIAAERVLFPPLNLGFAETHMSESYRPPTWTRASEIDERGFYTRGSRAPAADALTDHAPVGRPVEIRFGEPERNSPWRHVLGTDVLGRDLLVRILYGGRVSLAVGFVSTLAVVAIGLFVGAIAGYFGGLTDSLCSRVIEIFQSVPAFFLILTAAALVPERTVNPIFTIVAVIGIVRWTGVARLVRGKFLELKEQEFVLAARALGLRPSRVIFRHVLPNALGPVLVAAAFGVASGVLTESAISFLGFGVKHPIPSWGSLLNESRAAEQWWLQVFPGFLIFLTVFCYNLLGEGIRDALDPRMKA